MTKCTLKNQRSRYLIAVVLLSITFPLSAYQCSDDTTLGVNPGTSTGGDGGDGSVAAPDDSDDDGLSDEVETTFETEERTADTDRDGFSDGVEFVSDEGDPLNQSKVPTPFNRFRRVAATDRTTSNGDRDNDGLASNYEDEQNLDPDSADSDGDGYADGLELVATSDPCDAEDRPTRDSPPTSDGINRTATSPLDADRDGLSDNVEQRLGSSPANTDTDRDGFGDQLEFLTGSEVNDGLVVPNFTAPNCPETTTATTSSTTTTT